MNKIKNAIAMTPLYAGVVFKLLGEKLVALSIHTHIKLKTPLGIKMLETQYKILEMAKAYKAAQGADTGEPPKLDDIMRVDNPTTNEPVEGVIQLGKKRNESKD